MDHYPSEVRLRHLPQHIPLPHQESNSYTHGTCGRYTRYPTLNNYYSQQHRVQQSNLLLSNTGTGYPSYPTQLTQVIASCASRTNLIMLDSGPKGKWCGLQWNLRMRTSMIVLTSMIMIMVGTVVISQAPKQDTLLWGTSINPAVPLVNHNFDESLMSRVPRDCDVNDDSSSPSVPSPTNQRRFDNAHPEISSNSNVQKPQKVKTRGTRIIYSFDDDLEEAYVENSF